MRHDDVAGKNQGLFAIRGTRVFQAVDRSSRRRRADEGWRDAIAIEVKLASFPSENGIIARGEKMTTGGTK